MPIEFPYLKQREKTLEFFMNQSLYEDIINEFPKED